MTPSLRRRRLLALAGAGLGGCVRAPGTGAGDGVSVSVAARDDPSAGPVEYAVDMVDGVATDTRPARLRVTITNPTEARVVLGEERDVKFHHVASADTALYLHPAGDDPWTGPVEPGCWRLTEYVAVPEYYGTVPLPAGETVTADAYVYGHPELPGDACLPAGDHRLETTGVVGADEEAVFDGAGATEFGWEFTLRVGD